MSGSLSKARLARRAGWRYLYACAVVVLLVPSVARAQPTAAEYRVYALKHKSAAEVEPMLGQMLPGLGVTTHVVADVRANQILVRGPETVQQIARQMIDSIDCPPPPAKPVVRSYRCPKERQAEISARLRSLYPGRDDVRVAADPQTEQVFVLALSDVQDAIAAQLAAMGLLPGGAVDRLPAPVPGVDAMVAAGSAAAPGVVPGAPPAPAGPPPVVAPVNVRVEQIEAVLGQLLGARLVAMPLLAPGVAQYVFVDAAGKRVELVVDRSRNRVAVTGAEPLATEFVRLVESLDQRMQPGRAQRIVPVHRADPAKVEQAVRAYRSANEAAPPAPGRRGGSSAGPPRDDSGAGDVLPTRGSIGLVAYLFQPADAAAKAAAEAKPDAKPAAPTTAVVPGAAKTLTPQLLRALGSDVEVEVLPDLDVVILRGREQDVAELSRIIEELERLSAETQPTIEIYPLRHVGSEPLVTLVAKIQDSLTGGMQGRVSITPLVKPNALLLIGWGEAVKAVKELIAKLDEPVAPESMFRTFPLKHAPAATVQTTVQQFFTGRTGLNSKVQVSADLRTNAVIVQAAPRDMIEVAAIIESIDRGESSAVNQTRIVKLRFTLAADLAPTLQSAIDASRGSSGTAPAATTSTTAAGAKSAVLELITVDPSGKKVLKSGILADVKITPDPRLNTLIVSAPAESLELVVALIQELDQPVIAAQIKVFRIVNGDASNLVLMLRALLLRPEGTTGGAQLPITTEENAQAPLRFSVDTRTNSIIAVGGGSDLRIVEALLLRLDEQDVAERRNAVFRLKNAPALDVANAINEFLRSERQVQQAAPGAVSPYQQIESEVVVVPEPVSNTLILSATPRYFQKITDVIEKLDAQPPQVLIQVLIAEVSLSNFDEFGIEVGLQDSVLFDRSLLGSLITLTNTTQTPSGNTVVTATNQNIVAASNAPGYVFNNTDPLGNSGSSKALATPNLVGGQTLSNFGVGRSNSKLGYGGLVLSASSENVSVLMRALQELHCLRVLSRPQIMTLDNQAAYIQVGRRVPRITGTAVNQVGSVNSIALENVGLILGVTPRISPEGLVVMEIDAEKSQLGAEAEGIPVSISTNGTVIRSPFIDVTTAQTTVSAASGETIMFGGLITKQDEKIDRRVPYLSDIPILGDLLFHYKSNNSERTELLIVLTPHVIRGPADSERVRQIEAARMHWCLRDVEQVHGDLGLAGRGVLAPTIHPDDNPRGVPESPAKPIPAPDTPLILPETVPPPQPGLK